MATESGPDFRAYSYILYALRDKDEDRLQHWMHCAMLRVRKLLSEHPGSPPNPETDARSEHRKHE